MSELTLRALLESCPAFNESINQQYSGSLSDTEQFRWQSALVNSGHSDAAIEFTKINPNCTPDKLEKLDIFIAEAPEKGIKPTKCTTFGCTEEQIAECHRKVIKNDSGEAVNSPAYFLKDAHLERLQQIDEFNALKEEVFERIINGDKSAHLDERFIQASASMKSIDLQIYTKLKDELKEQKLKITAFDEEVNKFSKSLSKSNAMNQAANIELPDILIPYADGLDGTDMFIGEDGYTYEMVKPLLGDPYPVMLSNFVARIIEVLEFDDGIEIEQQFVIDGILEGTINLPSITVAAKDFRSMNWVLRRWGNVIITSQSKASDVIRETMQFVSKNAPITKVHYQIGWKMVDDVWYYLFSGGSTAGDNISVAEITELRGYYFKDYSFSSAECAAYVEKFLNVAPHDITIPLLAHAFLSLLLEKLKHEEIEVKYLMWVYGVSGSLKTSLLIVLLNFFGSFSSPPATFNDTAAALEKKSYLAKDSLLLVDDFYPAASPQEAKNKANVANGLTRRYGDRITRSRSKSNLTLAKDYPPRGNAVCTSEDLLVGHSTNSRHIGISVNRGDVKTDILTDLQNNKEKLACFMLNFIQYVADNIMNDDSVTFKDKFLEYRDKSQDSNHHRRFAESIACLQIGWDVLLDFLKSIGHIDEDKRLSYLDEGFQIFRDLAKRQNDLVQNDDIADKFMGALKELIDTKQIVPQNKLVPVTLSKTSTICYEDQNNYYFVPQSTYAAVAEFFIKKGDLLNIGEYMLRKMLADKKYLVESPDNDGHKTTKIKVGLSTIRVLQITKSVMNTF